MTINNLIQLLKIGKFKDNPLCDGNSRVLIHLGDQIIDYSELSTDALILESFIDSWELVLDSDSNSQTIEVFLKTFNFKD